MRRSVISIALMLTASAPALAANVDALREGLDHLPESVFVQEKGDVAYFADVDVMSAQGESGPANSFVRLFAAADFTPLQSLASSEQSEWETKAGTTRDKVRYFTSFGVPPNTHTFWGLVDEASATELVSTLETIGFESAGMPGVVGNGEPMQFNPQDRDPANPWRTRVGAAQFAAATGTNVVQAQTPQAAMTAASDQPRLGQNPIIATALAGLEQSAGEAHVVQAVVISPLFGLAGLDPAAVLSPTADIAETRAKIEAQMEALGKGIPAYMGGIVADIQTDKMGAAIALAYPDCTVAQAAADAIAGRWSDMAPDTAQGEIETGTAEGVDGLCAAVVTVLIDESETVQNPAYAAVLNAHMRREASVLQIGSE
ncbi:hypothetical protein SAMN06295905_0553 [Devosia lucknowensis]|uniref:Uncharacterized protein n=1 Tax=Devosia lucknowensis TaxID=1096929 RepID=A0A1Y6EGD8_9HYPH|nr:hypothetical protein [Devosia lucknowensis]SMQ61665.1 hypothetical protein SAMN06295905_0553 [Devosia lucknowensis]